MPLRTDLRTTNARLKALGCRSSVLERGDLKYLQAILPLREGAGKKQQRIPLGRVSLKEAELEGVRLGQMLRSETFAWELWEQGDEVPTGVITAGEFRAAARRLWEKNLGAHTSWRQKWGPALRKLPEGDGVPLTEKFLVAIVEGLEAGTAGRKIYGNILAQVADSVGIDGAAIRKAGAGYSPKNVQRRELPSDEEIEAAFQLIQAPHWRWTFAVCATYGIRPHEIDGIQFSDEWDALIPDGHGVPVAASARATPPTRSTWPKPSTRNRCRP